VSNLKTGRFEARESSDKGGIEMLEEVVEEQVSAQNAWLVGIYAVWASVAKRMTTICKEAHEETR